MFPTSFTFGLFLISLDRDANLSVLFVSSINAADGVTVQIIKVFAFPPKHGCKSRVILLSRYGICPRWDSLLSESLDITVPRVSRLLLIRPPSLSRTPSEPVWLTLSDPARSTRLRDEILFTFVPVTLKLSIFKRRTL
jgi:hypothetical protein